MLKLVALAAAAALVAAVDYYDLPKETRLGMLGTRLDKRKAATQGVKTYEISEMEALEVGKAMPAAFDSGNQWPQCANTINFIKDQAACGSCWAVAASSAIADRFCISCGYGSGANNNEATTGMKGQQPNEQMPGFVLSAEDLMSCCRYCGDGCQGGYPIDAMRYAYIKGFVSGGWYGSQCGCQSYTIKPIRQSLQPTPPCKATCDSGSYPEKDGQDRHKVTKYQYVRGEKAMMKAIKERGPLECAFTVMDDFEPFFQPAANHKKVYTGKNAQGVDGGHAIKITGWGQQMQDGVMTKFWMIHNSWNVTWADSGKFRYLRGKNLFGMEDGCVEASPVCGNSDKHFDGLQCAGRDFNKGN